MLVIRIGHRIWKTVLHRMQPECATNHQLILNAPVKMTSKFYIRFQILHLLSNIDASSPEGPVSYYYPGFRHAHHKSDVSFKGQNLKYFGSQNFLSSLDKS